LETRNQEIIKMIEKYDPKILEEKYASEWENSGVYKFDRNTAREDSFAIDTPPPTVSGSLHMGHVMGYAQTDILARFHRMSGKNVFFPIGWDDNGLPTERRVQNYFNIKCDPKIAYDPDFKPDHKDKFTEPQQPVSRRNFIEACNILIHEDEKVFEAVWRRLGYSYDWGLKYSTISDTARRIAQEAFIKFYNSGNVKSVDSPTMWDTTFQTAVAQAEIEDREIAGHFHDIRFHVDGGEFIIATTRPEFLPACIAIVAHPDDSRYKDIIGKNAVVPLFGHSVPILASPHADPEKGTGIMMVCTFGDAEDVKFWKTHGLPLRQIIGRDGKVVDTGILPENENFAKLVGLPIKAARRQIVEMLRESGDLTAEPRPITHAVKFYEKGDVPIEFVPSRQWFVRLLDKKEKLSEFGARIGWFPEYMGRRLQDWIDGLNQDWAISRQRFFGVPFPVWYRLDDAGEPDFDNPILAAKLPCDPLAEAPDGFDESRRGQPNGFIGDPDVMDTWATSSLTPQIAMEMAGNPKNLSLPFNARNSGPEIIRTWNFYTIAQDMMNADSIPWNQCWVNGWVLDPDRKKMSKSLGNVVVPTEIIEKYGADAIRLWAGSMKWGTDAACDEKSIEAKRKLCMKFFNAAKFVFGFRADCMNAPAATADGPDEFHNPVDTAFTARLNESIQEYEKYFKENDYAGALASVEQAFWDFCDNYLEITKGRAYSGDKSALKSLTLSVESFCALFAPFMPFITEEVWQSRPWSDKDKSIHNQPLPSKWPDYINGADGDTVGYRLLCELVSAVRGKKSTGGKSVKFPIKKLVVRDDEFLRGAAADIKNVLNADKLEFAGNDLISELEWGEAETK
jgi:valyl-tRNA synthetase